MSLFLLLKGYPDDDLVAESCLRIVAKLRPYARTRLKALKVIPHLSSHFRLGEQDQIDIVGELVRLRNIPQENNLVN